MSKTLQQPAPNPKPAPDLPARPDEPRPVFKPGFLPPVEPRPMPESPLENPEQPPIKIYDPGKPGGG